MKQIKSVLVFAVFKINDLFLFPLSVNQNIIIELFNVMKSIGLFVLMITLITVSAKRFTRCQLAKELYMNGIPKTFISNWVCLIESESGAETSKVQEFPNLSTSYGIFQINSKEWCRKGRKGGECGMKCEDFLNEDIKDDIKCAKVIYNRNGFKGWKEWSSRCKNRPLPDVSKCFGRRKK